MANKIAIIKTGGKQYKVKEDQTLKIEKLNKKNGVKVAFDTLLTASTDGKEVNIGKPSLGKKVTGEVLEQAKDKKVSVIKYKNKTRYLRNKGHRQNFTKVEIGKIG
ncbi:MAG: 50S ribosomal protein L21 [Patescibacteria group bacterium]|nr:50S ribosomal protein L21 [Patescibacteria group bacterium]